MMTLSQTGACKLLENVLPHVSEFASTRRKRQGESVDSGVGHCTDDAMIIRIAKREGESNPYAFSKPMALGESIALGDPCL